MTQKFKIVESIPDKNGIIIIAIKPDENGSFNSREEAVNHLHNIYKPGKTILTGRLW